MRRKRLTQKQLRIIKRFSKNIICDTGYIDDNYEFDFVYHGKNHRRNNAFVGHTEQDGYDYVMLIIRRELELNIENTNLVGENVNRNGLNEILKRWCDKMQTIFKTAENTYEVLKIESWEI